MSKRNFYITLFLMILGFIFIIIGLLLELHFERQIKPVWFLPCPKYRQYRC